MPTNLRHLPRKLPDRIRNMDRVVENKIRKSYFFLRCFFLNVIKSNSFVRLQVEN